MLCEMLHSHTEVEHPTNVWTIICLAYCHLEMPVVHRMVKQMFENLWSGYHFFKAVLISETRRNVMHLGKQTSWTEVISILHFVDSKGHGTPSLYTRWNKHITEATG